MNDKNFAMKPTIKPTIKQIFLIHLFVLFALFSCNEDPIQETQNNQEEVIAPNSSLANLMSATSSNDGSIDDILDGADCFSVNLPVTITAGDITFTINTLDDLELLEDILDELDDDDILEFLFPITITFNDFEEVVIENEEQFEEFVDACFDDDDDIIECVDFQYPISFSIYNTDFQVIDTITVDDDEELYEFLESLEDDENGVVLASLNFPVTLIYANGETIEVNNNQELEDAIIAAEDDCEDEDECDVSLEELEWYLMDCGIVAEIYNQNETVSEELYLDFDESGELIATGEPTVTEAGSWEIQETDLGYVLVIEGLETFAIANGEWLLEECDEDDENIELEFVKEADNDNFIMELYSECDDNEVDCNEETVELNLKDCVWYAELNDDFFENLEFDFTEGFNLYVYQENNVIAEGNWSVSEGENTLELYVEIDFEGLTGTWQIVECDDDRFELVRGEDILILEQDCEDDSNPFECFSSFEAEIVVCDDNNDSIETFDLTTAYANCNPEADVITYHETISDADNAVNAIASPEAYTNIANPQTIYVRVEIGEDFEVFPLYIYAEDCSDESCSEADVDAYLVECIWNVVNLNGSNDLIIYNMDFEPNSGVLVIYTDSETIDASWSTSETDDGVWLEFSNVNGANIQVITGNWLIVECSEEVLHLQKGDDNMLIERNCE